MAAAGCSPRFTDKQRRRLARAAKGIPRRVLRRLGTIVTPDTLLRWYRRLVAAKYDGSANRRGFGRPPIASDLQSLIISIATNYRSWGYTRINGVLQSLGITVSRSTIARILRDAGIEPAPKRGKGMSWKTCIESHFGCIAAIDTFTVEVLTLAGLVRYHVLFVIDIATRRVEIAGITNNACGRWTEQIARNLIDEFEGFLSGLSEGENDDGEIVCSERLGGVLKHFSASPRLVRKGLRPLPYSCASRISECHRSAA